MKEVGGHSQFYFPFESLKFWEKIENKWGQSVRVCECGINGLRQETLPLKRGEMSPKSWLILNFARLTWCETVLFRKKLIPLIAQVLIDSSSPVSKLKIGSKRLLILVIWKKGNLWFPKIRKFGYFLIWKF